MTAIERLNETMTHCAAASDWSPMIALNREIHLRIFSHSPHNLILAEVQRLWALADPFIAAKMAFKDACVRTVAEHERIIASLRAHDRHRCLREMELHRQSTASGLAPELPRARTLGSQRRKPRA